MKREHHLSSYRKCFASLQQLLTNAVSPLPDRRSTFQHAQVFLRKGQPGMNRYNILTDDIVKFEMKIIYNK